MELNEFLKNIKKISNVTLSLVEQDEWENYFDQYKTDLTILQSEMDKIDSEINQIIYKLYRLSDDEIRLVTDTMK